MRDLRDWDDDNVPVGTDADGVMVDLVIPRRVTHPCFTERTAGRDNESEHDEAPEDDDESSDNQPSAGTHRPAWVSRGAKDCPSEPGIRDVNHSGFSAVIF